MIMVLLTGTGNSILQFFTVLLIFVLVLVVTVYTTRWIGNYQKKNFVQKNLEVCEFIRIGNNNSIAIIRAGENRYLVVGIGKEEMRLLCELTRDEITDYGITPDTKAGTGSFSATLKKMLEKNNGTNDKQ